MATNETAPLVRKLSQQEIKDLLNLAMPAHLASLDDVRFPRITPIWFLWEDEIFYMSSGQERRHVHDLAHDPRAGLSISIKEEASGLSTSPGRKAS